MADNSLPQNRGHWSWGFLEAKGSDGDLALAELLRLLHLHLVEPGLLEGLAQGGVHGPVVFAGNPCLFAIFLGWDRGRVTWSREELKSEIIRVFFSGRDGRSMKQHIDIQPSKLMNTIRFVGTCVVQSSHRSCLSMTFQNRLEAV